MVTQIGFKGLRGWTTVGVAPIVWCHRLLALSNPSAIANDTEDLFKEENHVWKISFLHWKEFSCFTGKKKLSHLCTVTEYLNLLSGSTFRPTEYPPANKIDGIIIVYESVKHLPWFSKISTFEAERIQEIRGRNEKMLPTNPTTHFVFKVFCRILSYYNTFSGGEVMYNISMNSSKKWVFGMIINFYLTVFQNQKALTKALNLCHFSREGVKIMTAFINV